MPNHITNVITASAEVIAALRGEESEVDFNTLEPMPETIKNCVGCMSAENMVKLVAGEVKPPADRGEVIAALIFGNVMRDLESGGIKKMRAESFEAFITMARNVREHGHFYWMGWACEKWGTKWNAYDIEPESETCVRFSTAWSAPHPILEKLAKKFTSVTIKHEWADEDTGNNLGSRTYSNGASIDLEIADPVDFALTLTRDDREYYRKNADTGLWELYDPEEVEGHGGIEDN